MNPEIATLLDDGTYGQREMTDDEYAEYLATTNIQQETATDEAPASDDAGAPSTDAG